MPTITFDTGALIALESKERRMRLIAFAAQQSGVLMVVPTPVIAEWWRGNRGQRSVLEMLTTEPSTDRLAKLAGEAIAATPGATPIDAIVMASAAQRGDIVYTSDFGDLTALQAFFPGVRVMRV